MFELATSPEGLTLLMFIGLLIGVSLGYPIAFVMLGVSLIVGVIGVGPIFFHMMLMRTFESMNNYVLAAIPLFVFMGIMLEYSGISERLFETVLMWLGGLPGALFVSTIVLGTILATCTGIVGASVSIMGILVLPEMLRRNYDKAMSTGAICASGTLGILIPPSIMLVVYGPMAGVSVVQLFAGAIVPGLILSGMFMVYVLIKCILNPNLGPPLSREERNIPIRKKLIMLVTNLLPPVFIVLSVLGSIFFGIAAITEAAATGALASIILTALYGQLNWKTLKESSLKTLTLTSMIMFITFAAFVFTGTFMMIGGKKVVTDLILGFPLPAWGMLAMMMFAYFFLGFFMDWIGIIPILVPIFAPVVQELGFNLVWFSILACVCMQTSFLTPPLALSLFYLKGVSPEGIDFMQHIVRGAIPFIILQVIGLTLIVLFPQLVLWLPSLIVG